MLTSSETKLIVNWVVIRFDNPIGPVYAVLDGWQGKDTPYGDHYKLSTAIVSASVSEDDVEFTLGNKSTVKYDIGMYGLNSSTEGAWKELLTVHGNKVSVMPYMVAWDFIEYDRAKF